MALQKGLEWKWDYMIQNSNVTWNLIPSAQISTFENQSKKSLRQDLWRTKADARAVKSLMFSGVLSKGVNVHIFALSIVHSPEQKKWLQWRYEDGAWFVLTWPSNERVLFLALRSPWLPRFFWKSEAALCACTTAIGNQSWCKLIWIDQSNDMKMFILYRCLVFHPNLGAKPHTTHLHIVLGLSKFWSTVLVLGASRGIARNMGCNHAILALPMTLHTTVEERKPIQWPTRARRHVKARCNMPSFFFVSQASQLSLYQLCFVADDLLSGSRVRFLQLKVQVQACRILYQAAKLILWQCFSLTMLQI